MDKQVALKNIALLVKQRGGRCLSKEYINNTTKLLFKCSHGHSFHSTPRSIKQGKWCAECSGNKKGSIEKMQELARKHGGKCISDKYVNAHTHLMWECSEGHRWTAKPNNVKTGHWCNKCVLETKSHNAKKQRRRRGQGLKMEFCAIILIQLRKLSSLDPKAFEPRLDAGHKSGAVERPTH